MKFFSKAKDGGPESTVTGYWLIEIKWLFSIVLLRFDPGSRSSYHSHAFNSISWLKGLLIEEHLDGTTQSYTTGLLPIVTKRSTFHRVFSLGTSWVLSFRGPWDKSWFEWSPVSTEFTELTHGRVPMTSEANG